jgi:hypothetical protein
MFKRHPTKITNLVVSCCQMSEGDEKVIDDEVAAMFDLKLKKKKKKKKVTEEVSDTADSLDTPQSAADGGKKSTSDTDGEKPDYSYNTLLNRIVDLLHHNNPELSEKRRFTMKPPQLMRGKITIVTPDYTLASPAVVLFTNISFDFSTFIVNQSAPRRLCGQIFRRYVQ